VTIGTETLRIARTVRTSDVADALDSMGMQERFQMDPAMRPLFAGIRFAGLATGWPTSGSTARSSR
jgi:hypothetical protein